LFIEAKDDGSGGDNWSYKVVQSSSQIITTNKPTPSFLQDWREKYHIPQTCPKLTWGLQTLFLTINSSLPWGRVAMALISPLMTVPQTAQIT